MIENIFIDFSTYEYIPIKFPLWLIIIYVYVIFNIYVVYLYLCFDIILLSTILFYEFKYNKLLLLH